MLFIRNFSYSNLFPIDVKKGRNCQTVKEVIAYYISYSAHLGKDKKFCMRDSLGVQSYRGKLKYPKLVANYLSRQICFSLFVPV